MISFDPTENSVLARDFYRRMALRQECARSRSHDEEGALPSGGSTTTGSTASGRAGQPDGADDGFVQVCIQAERSSASATRRCTYACRPRRSGGSAVAGTGTAEQRERFLRPFRESAHPIWGAMAITEANAGSDSAAIQTSARFDAATDEWVLNGTKIFCTAGEGASQVEGGFVVVWATVDKSLGRGGIKSFVVPARTPGMRLGGLEKKLGIRASDTATIVFEDWRVPSGNLLGCRRRP